MYLDAQLPEESLVSRCDGFSRLGARRPRDALDPAKAKEGRLPAPPRENATESVGLRR